MSWDLYIQDWGDFNKLSEIPDDFKPLPIGTRAEIIEKIKQAEPLVDFNDESLGRLDTSEFSIEFNMGEAEILNSFVLHVRGNELAVPVIGNILDKLKLKAADGGEDSFFDINSSKENMSAWIQMRNKIIESQES